jgi:hypothetical protein
VHFEFSLTGMGWARASLQSTNDSAQLTASYLSDALPDLLRALLELVGGAERATCTWEEEPGEYSWEFDRVDDVVHVRITGEDVWDDDDDEPCVATCRRARGRTLVPEGPGLPAAVGFTLPLAGVPGLARRHR